MANGRSTYGALASLINSGIENTKRIPIWPNVWERRVESSLPIRAAKRIKKVN